jgi:hypothetical protein
MKIDSASFSLSSSHLAFTRDEEQESLFFWRGDRRPDITARESTPTSIVALSSAARASLAAEIQRATAAQSASQAAQPAPAASAVEEAVDAVDNDPYLQLIKFMVEMMTGEPVKSVSARQMRHLDAPPPTIAPTTATPAPARRAGFGIEYEYHAVHEEFEQTRVSAEGKVKTADGKEISFRVELSMARSHREETSVSFRAGDAVRKDPLVLNFNGTAAQLSDRRLSFDLDGNGRTENLAMLAGGSGYLAIDRNGNGKIDSGLELFGPATNSGFGKLAALDSDGNRWIDDNDSAFGALRIWTPDAQGNGMLETLAQRKVGALAVDHVASPFELRGAGNGNLGAISASGIYLTEDGRAGSVQEVLLTV